MSSMIRVGLVSVVLLLTVGAALQLVGVLAFLIILGGIVSYLGDLLGTYFAKRKLSLFGLRPKRTGTVISMVTGILITLATLGGAMLVSEDYKNALLNYRTLREDQLRLQKVNAELTSKEKQMSLALGVAGEELKKVTRDLEEAEKVRQGLSDEIEALHRDKEEKVKQIASLEEALKKKETGRIVILNKQELLPEPSLFPFSGKREELIAEVTELLSKIDQAVSAVDVEMNMPPPDVVDRELVTSIWEKFVGIRENYRKYAENEPHGMHATECIIQPLSIGNLSRGEKLTSVYFDIQPNRVLFTPGEEVERMRLDASLSEKEMLERLFFFDRVVEDRMLRKGVLASTLGHRRSLASSALVLTFTQLIEKVKALGGWVIVRLVAVTPIRNAGNFDATYQIVGPASEEGAPGASPAPSPSPAMDESSRQPGVE